MNITHLPYDANEVEDARYFHEHYWKECALQLLLREVGNPQGAELLDYGCGRGEFLAMARAAGFKVSGLDIDPACVELARRVGPAGLIAPEDYLESLPGASVDVISSLHVLEHVENPKRLLGSMRRVARRYVLIAVPNLRAFRPLRTHKQGATNEGHLQGWDRETLINLAVRHCGLDLVAFATDMTKIPSVSYRICQLFGSGAEKVINLKLFSHLWPQRSLSIIALFRVPA
ncbi:MAG: class I SAM-dependent methyltransferase [bacterium]